MTNVVLQIGQKMMIFSTLFILHNWLTKVTKLWVNKRQEKVAFGVTKLMISLTKRRIERDKKNIHRTDDIDTNRP